MTEPGPEPTRRERRAAQRRTPPRRLLVVAGVVVAAVLGVLITVLVLASQGEPPTAEPTPSDLLSATPTPTATPTATPTPTPTPTPTFDMARFSIDDPASPWVVVNKLRPLAPQDYAPGDLVDVPVPFVNAPLMRAEASGQLVAMFQQFTAETGLQMQSQSAYRSYGTQVSVYNGWVARLGQEAADLTSARPGHSEHQTGLVMDISAVPATCALDQCFADTPQGQWLAANAWKWGFILRYPNGLTHITGYEFEPWHYRYVGVDLATQMHDRGILTLEEFFGLPPAPTYGG